MRILLLTDIPPCKNFTAGLVLDQLCRFLPEGSIACFAVVNRNINARLSPDLDWIPVEYAEKPREYAIRLLPGRFGALSAFPIERYNALVKTKPLISRAVNFGRQFSANAVWCVLQGQTMIRMARQVAKALEVPLLTQIWDPLSWWLRANQVDRISRSLISKEFDRVLMASRSCAAASWAMAQEYNRKYGVACTPLILGIDPRDAVEPAERINQSNELIIGIAGQLYAADAWYALLSALDRAGWKVRGRDVRIRFLGRRLNLSAENGMRVEYLGWHPQKEVIRLLSQTDILYCPYWFDPNFAEEARLCFPSKLVTYLASGRPILFHGPEYSSPALFLKENNAAIFCHSLQPRKIFNAIESCAINEDLYYEIVQNGRAAFIRHLTKSTMRVNFAHFLDIDERFLNEIDRL